MKAISDRQARQEFGRTVRATRIGRGMSQREVGERAGRPAPQAWSSAIEAGRYLVVEKLVRDVAKALGVPEDELMPEQLLPKRDTESEEDEIPQQEVQEPETTLRVGQEPANDVVDEQGSSPPVETGTCEPASHWCVEYRGYRGIKDGTIFCQKCGQSRRIPS